MDLLKVIDFQVQGVVGDELFASYSAPEFLASTIDELITGSMAGFTQGILLGMAIGQNYDVDPVERIYLQGLGMLPGLIIELNQRCTFDHPTAVPAAPVRASVADTVEREQLRHQGRTMGVTEYRSVLDSLFSGGKIPAAV